MKTALFSALLTSLLAVALPAAERASLVIAGRPVEARLTALGENTLRVSFLPVPAEGGEAKLPSIEYMQPLALQGPAQSVRVGDAGKPVEAGVWKVTMQAQPLALRIEKSGRVVQEMAIDADGVVSFAPGDGAVLGLGEGGRGFDRRGGFYPDENGQQNEPDKLLVGARVASPFLIGTSGWALFMNTPRGEFDLRGERGVVRAGKGATPGLIDFFVMDARHPTVAIEEFTKLTGRPALPPRWALGYMQSHRTLAGTGEMLEVAETFRAKKLPCDALIYLGTGFCPMGWNEGHDSFAFHPKLFTRPAKEVIGELQAKNFKVVLHVVPPRGNLHGTIPPGDGEVQDTGHIASYWQRHQVALDAGTDGWWPDEGDWFNVPQRLARHRMYYHGSLANRPGERPWSLHRNGFPGMNPYGGWVWSGDVAGKWATLAAQVAVGINTSLSLTPYWGTDVAGFFNSAESSGELFVRWFQFATFCPSFRSHGLAWHTRLPWGWNTGDPGVLEGEKYPRPEALHEPEVETICRDYLNLRYRLLPYTYGLAREAHDTGLPLMRALWLHYPDDAEAVKRGDEFLWGRDLLVAPVVQSGTAPRRVYLPKGDWYDWWTGERLAGGREITRAIDLKTMPLYVRAGAIVPLDPVRQFTGEAVAGATTLQVYRGADGSGLLYEDDGHSLGYLADEATWTRCEWHDAESKLELSLDPRSKGPVASRRFEVLLLPDGVRKTVEFTGAKTVVHF